MFGGAALVSPETIYCLKSYGLILAVSILGSTPLPKKLIGAISQRRGGQAVLSVLKPITTAVILIIVTAFLIDSSFNPFLYFRF